MPGPVAVLMPLRPLVTALVVSIVLSGCAVVGDASPSQTRDGKCHGPDYNASDCVYLY